MEHKESLQRRHKFHIRRLEILEEQIAFSGEINAPPEKQMARDEEKDKIKEIEDKLAELASVKAERIIKSQTAVKPEKTTGNIDTILAKWGFRDNPFRYEAAQSEKETDFAQYFVRPQPSNTNVYDVRANTVLYAAHGMGKTSLAKMIRIDTAKNGPATLFLNFGSEELNSMLGNTKDFLEEKDYEHKIIELAYPKLSSRARSSRPDSLETVCKNLENLTRRYTHLCVLVDDFDRVRILDAEQESGYQKLAQLIGPLLSLASRLSRIPNLTVKLFLPVELRKKLRSYSGISDCGELKWTEESLKKILQTRLLHYSETETAAITGRQSLDELVPYPMDSPIDNMAATFALGNPRNLIIFCRLLLGSNQDGYLTSDSIDSALWLYSDTIFRSLPKSNLGNLRSALIKRRKRKGFKFGSQYRELFEQMDALLE